MIRLQPVHPIPVAHDKTKPHKIMSSYDPYDSPTRERTKRYYREERREERDPRYESRDVYLSASRDLVPRAREDSDLSVEEIRRDFPPPSSRDIRRARSAGAGYYDDYDERRYDRDYDTRSSRKVDSYYEEEHRKKVRMLSKQEQIIAAITGAAIAIGGKELYDRRDAKLNDSEIKRNALASAALGAAGALAGYSGTEAYNKYKEKEGRKSSAHAHKGHDNRGYYDSSEDESIKEKKGHKNFLEAALAAAGLGGAVKALTGGSTKDDKSDRSDTRSRRGSGSSSKGGKSDGASKIQKAAMASLIAGATEAFRVSKEPGGWKGEKAKRILTAAAGAATIDAAQKTEKAGTKLGLAESVIGGLVGNRVINGSKKNIEEDEKTGRSRSRSRARSSSRGGGGGGVSGLAALATAGLGALGAKKALGHRDGSKSRGRSDSEDSRGGSPKRRHRSRSRSIVDAARRGLAKVGLGNGPDDEVDDRERRDRSRRDYDDYEGSNKPHRRRDSYDSDYDRDYDRDSHKSGRRNDYEDDRSHHRRDRHSDRDRGTVARRGSVSSSDLGNSDDDERRGKRMRGKQIITTGLAAVATIHAGANVYQSMEKRKKRHKAVREGRLSPEEAKKLKSRAILQDAASIGIAALGIKGAISELKEAREVSAEMREWRERKEERHKRRLERMRQGHNSGYGDVGGDGYDYGYGRHRADNWFSAAPPKADRYDDGPRYTDGNPYAALPPPTGPPDRR